MSKEKIAKLIAELTALHYTPKALRERLLFGILEMVSADAPCSVIHITDFFSAGGKYIGAEHTKRSMVTKYLYDQWVKHLKRGDSIIERGLFHKSRAKRWGIATLGELVTEEEWKNSPLYKLALIAGTGDMAYLWIRCASDELWVICLRRRKDDPKFKPEECELLSEFGFWFGAMRQSWYISGLNILTETEHRVVHELASGKTQKVCAEALIMAKDTFETHLKNIRRKLEVEASWGILTELAERTNRAMEE